MTAFTLNGKSFNVFIPRGGIKRSGQVLDGDNVGRSKRGVMIRDVIGTFYNYTISVDASHTSQEEYDRLYNEISAPVESHTITVPYGQITLSFQAYVTSAEDELVSMEDGENKWGGLTIKFIAMVPQRTPGGS